MFLRKLIGPRIDLREVTSKKKITKEESRTNEIYKKSGKVLQFPDNFLWGTSASAYQVEGGIKNDWSEWEKENAERLANKAKNYWQGWQIKKFPEMLDPKNYFCGKACDSYNRYEEDFDLATGLNNNAVRLGIEWARIEPRKGEWDMKEIGHYRKVLQAAKDRNLKTVVTLWHWTNPLWLARMGGWSNKSVVKYFTRYIELIAEELGNLIDYWVTLNEPLMHIGHGYLDGKFPPNKKASLIGTIKVFNNFAKAHKNGYKIIHNKYPKAPVSIATTTGYFEPARKWNLIEVLIAKLGHYFRNDWYLYKIKNYFDYIGINYYHHDRMVWHPPFKKNLNKKINDRGWEIYPEGIYYVLKRYIKFKKPMLILENGTADKEDNHRADFIKEHLYYMHKAIKEGADVHGYFYWSLLDNFEWAEGFWPKFGLHSVNRKTFERTARPSAAVYAEICKANKVRL